MKRSMKICSRGDIQGGESSNQNLVRHCHKPACWYYRFCLDFREYWDVRTGTGPVWVCVKWAPTERGPPLFQAEVHERRETASQESRTVSVTCVACDIEAG